MQSVVLWCLFYLFVTHHASTTTALAPTAFAVAAKVAQQTVRIQPAPVSNEVSRTLLALDANGDGIVSPTEVTAFAMSQGLDAASASQEFRTMDSNADGMLDKNELAVALGATVAELDHTGVAPATPVSAGADLAQQQQQERWSYEQRQEQVHNPNVASVPAQLSTGGTPAAPEAKEAAPVEHVVETRIQSFLKSRVSAKKAASEVVKLLSLEAQEESKAELFTRHSIELRANASSIARTASEQALKAGAEAAQKVAAQLLDKISKLEQQAKSDEVEAAQLRAKSHADIMHADQLMAVADKALKR